MKISSLLNEAEKTNSGAAMALPIDKDLIYKAKNKYPGYSPEQAMILLISDEMKNQAKTDSTQNTLIDTQKRENERLRGALNDLGQELQDFERQSVETDKEVARLKQLSNMLTTGGASSQQQAKVSADDLEKLQKDLEILKTKPGMDPEKFKNIELQIKEIANNPSINDDDIKKVNFLINTLNNQKTIGDELYKKLEDQLRKTQSDLDKKEGRFSKYIEKKKGEIGSIQKQNADEIKKYSDIVQSYQQDIEKFNTQVQKLNKDREFINNEKQIMIDLRAEVQQNAETIQQNADSINKDAKEAAELLSFIKQLYTKNIKDIDDTPSTPSTPDVDDIKGNKQNIPPSDNQETPDTEPPEQKDNVVPFPTQDELADLYKGDAIDAISPPNITSNDEEPKNDFQTDIPYNNRGKPVKPKTDNVVSLKGEPDDKKSSVWGNVKKKLGYGESVGSLLEYETTTFKIDKNWGDPRFNKWMKDNLSMLITLFKNKFREELSNKDPKYSDGQISYSIQEEAWYLKEIFENKEDSILTREKMDSYLTLVKRTLFSQPSNPTLHMQPNKLFNESLDKTYARMLDDIIGLAYIKKG